MPMPAVPPEKPGEMDRETVRGASLRPHPPDIGEAEAVVQTLLKIKSKVPLATVPGMVVSLFAPMDVGSADVPSIDWAWGAIRHAKLTPYWSAPLRVDRITRRF